jgi:hypothetical protein
MSENNRAENLASRILTQRDAAICVKLRDLKSDVLELRGHFKNLKGKATIAGCKTWAEFCEKKLHRTDRAVRKMLAGSKLKQAKEPQGPAEQSSAPSTESAVLSSDVTDSNKGSDEGSVDVSHIPDKKAQASELERGGISYADDLDRAKKKVRHLFSDLESVEEVERKLNQLLEGLIPCRKFIVTVEEVVVPAKPKTYHYEPHSGTPTGMARVSNSHVAPAISELAFQQRVNQEIANGEVGF